MERANKLLTRIENLVSLTTLAILLACVLWGVLTRYVTERPAVWTTELSGILFTWVVFIGAMTGFRQGRHIRVTLLMDILPTAITRLLHMVADLTVIAFLLTATWLSFVMMQKGASRMSPVMDIPFSWVYLAVLLSFSIMSITAMLRFFRILPETDRDVGDVL